MERRLRYVLPEETELCFDLENRPLAYWYDGQTTAEITAFGWKWKHEDVVHSMLLKKDGRFLLETGKTLSDRRAYEAFTDVLTSAGLVFGHNIRRHDLPMFQAGLLRRQLPILPELKTSDTLTDYPKRSGMSRSLENLAAMYELEGEKYNMSQPAWEKANRLSDDGMELAHKRVVADVLLQERLRDRLKGLTILKPEKTWKP